ncbi:MAG: hypothetical protein DMD33_03305 [Gemmatimonadetes bacterium]|nr:MAG: hypothetical protein DMD33_03305 [Gemmatimonadota bacterium]
MKPNVLYSACCALIFVTTPAAATTPTAAKLAQRMKVALEPARPSVRKMSIVISTQDGEATRWTVGQARKHSKDGNRTVTVVLEPADQRGIAFLMRESDGRSDLEQWVYIPVVRRVRRILPLESFQAFLGSDFTLADLGFVDLRATYKLLGTEDRGGSKAYKTQEIPLAPHAKWYYSRIVTWIAVDSSLPIERDFYDPSNTLWKIERFEQASDVDGVSTPFRVRMEDRQEGRSTELTIKDIRYDVEVSDALFDPTRLREASQASLWQQ